MAVQRKRFRIEDLSGAVTTLPEPARDEALPMPMHREIMSELRAIRDEMAGGKPRSDEVASGIVTDGMRAQLESYRARIEQCDRLKIELNLIHDSIARTKTEIAALHGKAFNGQEMAKVAGELGAVVGGTEEATQQILEAAEAIDQSASAIAKVTSADQQRQISEDIQERVVSIFEACNFQDITGQRISKVMATMRFIENHINVMMDIWGGIDAMKAHAPVAIDERNGDDRLLNGPKLSDDDGHVSQDDIDALFG